MVAMSNENELKKAMDLAIQGKRQEAAAILVVLESKIKEPNLRLRLIDASLSSLSPVKNNAKLIDLAEEAIKITTQAGISNYQAHFMARKADLLRFQITIRWHRVTSLTLTPGWIGFATEADKMEYEVLTSETKKMEDESDNLLEQALTLANKSEDKKTKAYILMDRGQVSSSKYLQRKTDCLRGTLYGKLWVKSQSCRYPIFENFFALINVTVRELPVYVKSFKKDLLEAGKLLEQIDDSAASSAYFNLANELKTAYRFREAQKHLKKSRTIALKYGDIAMIVKIDEMKKIIAARNKDVPDYIDGEERSNDTM